MINMIKKEILKNYIDGLNHQSDCDNHFNDVLKFIHADNYNISLVSESFTIAMDALIEEVIGKNAFDWLQWWLWETTAGIHGIELTVEPEIFDGEKLIHTIDTFDKLYDYLAQLE